jgi:hypothetical protein
VKLIILKFVYCGDVTTDVDHLYIKRIKLVGFPYIVIDDSITKLPPITSEDF